MSNPRTSMRSRVRQWCRQFRGLADRFSYTRYDFVDPSLIGRDGRLHPVPSMVSPVSYPPIMADDVEMVA